MKLIMKPRTHYYLLLAGIAVAWSACREPQPPGKVMAIALAAKPIPVSPAANQDDPIPSGSLVLQSTDGGLTWHDISNGLPEPEQPEGFFAGATEVYLRTKSAMYRSASSLKTPVWEKESVPVLRGAQVAFHRSGVLAYSYDGFIYQKSPASGTWLPVYTHLKTHSVQTIFETTDGSVFLSTGKSLSKSVDNARSWKLVQKGGVGEIVESTGVLLATGQKGIMRSTDKGEHWEWVISEGGVGIAIEPIAGGFAAISYNTKTESRRIHISLDDGKSWKAIEGGLPPSPSISSIKELGHDLFVGHPEGIFRSSDMGKTWQRVHGSVGNASTVFDAAWNPFPSQEDKRVFKLYVSGNVLYAVARNAGC